MNSGPKQLGSRYPTSSLPFPFSMYAHYHPSARDVGHACDMADQRFDIRMFDHAQIQSDQRSFVVDEDILPKERLGDGEHSVAGSSKRKQFTMGKMPYRALILCF